MQTFLQVHCARSRYLPGTDVAPWLFAIARHLLIDLRRRAKPSKSLSADYEEGSALPSELISSRGADEDLYSKQLGSLLDHKLRAVSEKHRVAFRLVKLDGLSHAEVAETMGTTPAAVSCAARGPPWNCTRSSHGTGRCCATMRCGCAAASRHEPVSSKRRRVLSFKVAEGSLFLASPDLPTSAMTAAMRPFTSLEMRFHLLLPSEYEKLAEALL